MHSKRFAFPPSLRHVLVRDYVLSFFAFFGFLCAFQSLTPTFPLYLAALGANAREIGVLVGTIGFASLISRFLVGRVLVRYPERSVMLGGAGLFALTFFALIAFRPFWPYLVIRLLQGIAFASLDTAAIAYAVRIIPEEYRARGIGYFLLATSLASALASASSVFMANSFGFTVVFLSCAALSLCAFLLSWSLRRQTARSVKELPAKASHFFEPGIIAPAVVSFMFFFSWSGVSAFFPLYSIACGVANPGLFFSASAVMIVTVRIIGGRIFEMYSREKIITVSLVVVATALGTLSFSRSLPMFLLVGALLGAAVAFLVPVVMAYALAYAGVSNGSAVATYQASMDLGLAVGPAVVGIIVPFIGYQATFLCLAFTCLVNLCYFQLYLKRKGRAALAV